MLDDDSTALRTSPARYDDERITQDDIPQITESSGSVIVYFEDIEDRPVDFISESKAVVSCVAWLTSEPVLQAMKGRPVNLIIQKEEILRPDSSPRRADLRTQYSALVGFAEGERYSWPEPVSRLSYLGDPTLDAVRCLGKHNSQSRSAIPRMHHKFLVSGSWIAPVLGEIEGDREWSPYRSEARRVWAGRYNPTRNAKRSLKNAVVINDKKIAERYFREFI